VEDRQLLNAVAAQLAVALDNARLHAALLGRERRELALRARALLDGAEEERRRLAADLHDHVLPDLRHIAGEAERLRRLAEGPGDGLAAGLAGLEAATRAAMGGAREVMEALRPSALDILGFSAALESTLRRSAARATPPLTAIFRREGPEPVLTPDQSLALFRIGQEAINNAVTHAGATTLTLEMTTTEPELHLRLADDGRGICFEPAPGRGIANMRHRAELIGATIAWQPYHGGGTVVEVRFPLEGNPRERA
jgi:signal transduction histidine kinase